MTLLMDALPLLEVDDTVSVSLFDNSPFMALLSQLVFSVDQTHALQHCLQELTISQKEKSRDHGAKSHDHKAKSHDHDKIQLLRKSLVRNLSRAMLEEC